MQYKYRSFLDISFRSRDHIRRDADDFSRYYRLGLGTVDLPLRYAKKYRRNGSRIFHPLLGPPSDLIEAILAKQSLI